MPKNIIFNNLPKMHLFGRKVEKKIGLSPGSILYTGEKRVESVKIFVTDFSTERVVRQQVTQLSEISEMSEGNRWIQISGLHDTDLLQQVGERFSIHSLVLEDIVNSQHPAKIEDNDDYVFIITKLFTMDAEKGRLFFENISFILLHNMMISFQETDAAHFDPILRRLENPKARMRRFGHDYFLYALLDFIMDHYFLIIEAFNDHFERLEQDVLDNPVQEHVEEIHKLKRQVVFFRKSVRPMREVVNLLMNDEIELISEKLDIFLRDLYDHTIQIIDSLETLRDLASGLLDTYLSQVSHRMNEVMKVLTIMSTIFIPLGFLAGLYGMNFENIPELHFKYGYFMLLGVMVTVVASMLLFFKHKRWI